MKISEVEEE